MARRPRPSLLRFAGYLLQLFAIWVISFMLLLFFLAIFDAQSLGEALVDCVSPWLFKSGATIFFLIVTGCLIESLR